MGTASLSGTWSMKDALFFPRMMQKGPSTTLVVFHERWGAPTSTVLDRGYKDIKGMGDRIVVHTHGKETIRLCTKRTLDRGFWDKNVQSITGCINSLLDTIEEKVKTVEDLSMIAPILYFVPSDYRMKYPGHLVPVAISEDFGNVQDITVFYYLVTLQYPQRVEGAVYMSWKSTIHKDILGFMQTMHWNETFNRSVREEICQSSHGVKDLLEFIKDPLNSLFTLDYRWHCTRQYF